MSLRTPKLRQTWSLSRLLLVPGRGYTLALVGVVPAGEGLLRYYPTTDGAVAAWDYVAETD